jgi:hypothetical protein
MGLDGIGGADKIELMGSFTLLAEIMGGVAGSSTSLGGRVGGDGEDSSSTNKPCVLLGGIGGAADAADSLEDDVRDESLGSLESIIYRKIGNTI